METQYLYASRTSSTPTHLHIPRFTNGSSSYFTKTSFLKNPRKLTINVPSNPLFTAQKIKLYHRKASPSTPKFTISAKGTSSDNSDAGSASAINSKLVIACSAATIALATANRVLYKLALVPMKEYPFFLAQITTFGYVIIYFSILYMRRKAGIVTDEMMKIPKLRFGIIGLLEALGVVSGMYAGANLPGPAIPVLSQTFLVWQLCLSVILLGRKFAWNKIAGCLLVAAGVVFAVASGSENDQMLSGVGLLWPAVMIISNAFQAGASILKESVFVDYSTKFKGKLLDIFVVNSFGSGFQALFVLLCLPLLSNLKGIPFSELPAFLKSGTGCLLNMGASGCDGAPLLPILYVVTNIGFNIAALNLVKISSAVVSSLIVMSSVPISIYILSRPLPYLPEGVNLSPFFLLGTLVLVAGLVLYNIPQPQKEEDIH